MLSYFYSFHLVTVAFLTVVPSLVYGQPRSLADTTVLRIETILDAVLEENPELRADRLRVDAAEASIDRASALPQPRVSVSYYPLPVFTAKGFQRSQLRVDQDLPYPGKRRLRAEVAEQDAEYARYRVDVRRHDLVLDVRLAYIELFRIQEQLALVDAFSNQLTEFVDAATTRYSVGSGSQRDILKAQLEKNRLDELALELASSKVAAAEILRRTADWPSSELAFESRFVLDPRPPIPDADTISIIHPDIRALAAAEEKANLELMLSEKYFLPDFSVGFSYSEIAASNLTPTMTGRDALGIHVSVRVPLWRDQIQSEIDESSFELHEIAARKEALVTAVEAEKDDLAGQIRIEDRLYNLLKSTLIPQAELTMEASLSAYGTGEADFLALLDAQRTLFDVRLAHLNSTARRQKLIARFDRAAGMLPSDQ